MKMSTKILIGAGAASLLLVALLFIFAAVL